MNFRGRPRRGATRVVAVLVVAKMISKRIFDFGHHFNIIIATDHDYEDAMKVLRNAAGGAGTIRELFAFLWQQKRFWLIPFVIILLLVGILVLVGEVTGVAPFIYTLF
jgi:hypothetical protein